MYYDINAYNSISSDINFRGRNTPSENTTTVNYSAVDTNYNYNYSSYLESTSIRNNISWNTDYTKTFEANEEKELSLSYQLGSRVRENVTEISEYDNLIYRKNINNEQNFEHTFQLDYTHPINDHIVEIGGKMIIRDQEMDYQTDSDSSSFIFPNEIFNYIQTVNALYLSTNINLPSDFSLKAGTRYEHTNIEGNWEKNSESHFQKITIIYYQT
jgi:outer membrane receptor protein involved in Fe transport